MKNTLVIPTIKDAQRAFVIAARTQASSPVEMMVAGAKAAMIVNLKNRMRNGVVEFYFYKRDGSLRHAFGTTQALVQRHINGRGISRDSVNTVAWFDVESGSWKSFRYESICRVC